MKQKLILAFLIFLSPVFVKGQETVVYDPSVKTVVFHDNSASNRAMPVFPLLVLGESKRIRISFDDLSAEYHRFTYTLELMDENFNVEESVFEHDYVESVSDEGLVENFTPSLNTSIPYVHYSLAFPNEYMRPKVSGIYKLTFWKENENGDKVAAFVTYFFVVEPLASLTVTVNGDTDIDRNKTHQQLTVSARCPSLSIRDAKEFTLVVLQNKQWHNAVRNVSPSSVSFLPTPTLKWEHCRDLIFKAGNEYRKFEIPSRRYPGMHVESVNNLSSYLHATLFPDEPRMTYLYDEDQDGIYVPLAEDNMNPETEAEYMWVHFDYSFPEKWKEELPHRIYLGGQWTNGAASAPGFLAPLADNPRRYNGAFLLKQGYYSYYYWGTDGDGRSVVPSIEGDFYQTQNEYTVLLYHRSPSDRHTRLIGATTVRKP